VTTVEASADHAAGQVIRVLTPVNAPADDRLIGVLEVDLPYQVVAAAVQAQARRLMVVLGLGLLGQYLVVAGISWVVTRRLRRQSDLHEYLANHDALTELPNRKLFRYHAETALERAAATDTSCCVAIVDLDRFKEVNDTLGHHVGDQLLRQVAERMRRALRTDDTVARLGGDEFGLVLPGTNAEQAVPVLEAIRKAVGADLLLAGLTMSVGSSFGVSSYPDQGNNVDILLQQADVAMYAAKAGQRGVVAYDPTIVPIGPDHLELASDLRRGIEHDELVLHYQPQLRLRDGAVTTVEALVRWQHPQRGLLYPDSFIEVAEQNDLVNALTYRVLRTALQQVLVWDAQGHRLRVAVNVSAHTMHDESFPGSVAALLAEAGLPTSRLLLELTETALVSDPAKVRSVMLALSDLGIALSLDDFGQGYTSLSFLRGLPLVEIKVDKAFVIGMGTGPDDAIVKSVIGLAHGLGLTVVAEGVEEQGVLDALRHMGCDIAQGYHIGRPVLPSELTAWLDAASDRLPLPLGRS
jgi:diguanylate cyclase (GGDEF)-like protein